MCDICDTAWNTDIVRNSLSNALYLSKNEVNSNIEKRDMDMRISNSISVP